MTDALEKTGGSRGFDWRIARWAVIAGLMAVPVIARRFTDTMSWTGFDFAVMAALLIGAGVLLDLVAWTIRRAVHRIVLGIGVVGGVLLV